MLSGLFGNASAVNAENLANELGPILIDGEQIDQAFRLVRDLYVFTNKRLILVDKQETCSYLSDPGDCHCPRPSSYSGPHGGQ